ncbi:hypothetical protein G3R49_02250 [Shewanella sp. WXL01]|uniref:Lipoprotein n=1 Tax=Shewanella maritima TaxID=2520507 RepID=A0A411PFW4_9GAMM|nr:MULTISPECIES: hypothetical protein [Shewanella]NKF49403.1 hypothetical protein [Shewanella sp. WXL01]QBF82486.1 hypothetical protein EXU30_07075 [Shewanella maritima]
MKKTLLTAVIGSVLLSACGATPPRVAQEKETNVNGETYVLGGQYDKDKNKLELTVNGEVVMQGRFPPYTPTQNLNATYEDVNFSGKCYFGSVLGDDGGELGIVAGIIQAAKSSSADKCEMFVNDKPADTLYF